VDRGPVKNCRGTNTCQCGGEGRGRDRYPGIPSCVGSGVSPKNFIGLIEFLNGVVSSHLDHSRLERYFWIISEQLGARGGPDH